MEFEKPDLDSLESERDVELKFLYPLLIGNSPAGLGFDPAQITAQKNLRKFSIGKGSDQKSYFPDYLVTHGTIPLMVIEAKKPHSDLLEAFREARLYASELNAIQPTGLTQQQGLLHQMDIASLRAGMTKRNQLSIYLLHRSPHTRIRWMT